MAGFVARCQNGDITGPQQKGFSIEGWQSAFEDAQDNTIEARRLYEAGLWYHNRFMLIRSIQSSFDLTLVSERQFKQYVVALLNRTLHEVHWFIEDKAKAQGFIAGEGIEVNGFESIITAGRLLLSYKGPFNTDPQYIGPVEQLVVESLASLAVIYDDHQSSWAKCLWRGYYIDQTGDKDVQRTAHPERERQRELAWTRHRSLSIQKEHSIKEAWAELEQGYRDRGASARMEIVAIERNGFRLTWTLGSPSRKPDELPLLISMFMEVEEAQFKALADRPFKKHPSITLRLLAEAFALLSSLAHKLAEGIDRAPWSSECVPQHCPIIEHERLIGLLMQGIGISADEAREALSYLTHGGHERHDLWSRPLVVLNPAEFALVLRPLTGVNPTWLLKNWMHDGGLEIDQRGESYEEEVRKDLRSNCRLQIAEVLLDSLFLGHGNDIEQIDLVIRIGNAVLIGEVKCSVFPTRPDEIHNYEGRLDEAAEQAIRKAERASRNKGTLARLFKGRFKSDRSIEVFPFVLSNLALGVGQHHRGVPVVDGLTLGHYLHSGEQTGYSVIHTPEGTFRQTQKIILYTSKEEAESNIQDFLSRPASLRLNTDLVEEVVSDWFPLPLLKQAAGQRFKMREAAREPKNEPAILR